MHYVSLRKVWKKVIKNKEVEGKKKKRRKRWWYGQGQGTEARLLNSSVLFLSLTFSWCPTSLLYTPSCSYSPMLLSRPSRWGSQSRTEPSKAKSSLGSKEHFWISWQRRLRQSLRTCVESLDPMLYHQRSRAASSGSRPAPTEASEFRVQEKRFHVTKCTFLLHFEPQIPQL